MRRWMSVLVPCLVWACGPVDEEKADPDGAPGGDTADAGTTGGGGPDPRLTDADGDGYSPPEDCDDNDRDRFPDASETCNGIDDDCNGLVDDDARDARIYFYDDDGDGYGDPASETLFCTPLGGYVDDGSDCNDANPDIHPFADEWCDDVDNDCDEVVDEPDALDASTWYVDDDGDGFGVPGAEVVQCDQPSGHAAVDTDCDDTDPTEHPDADEVCDGDDDNCDGVVDEDTAVDAVTWFADSDGDGFGDATVSARACDQPSNMVADDTDCDDTDATENPDADEVCDGDDDNCDGVVDEDSAADAGTWYADSDGDGFGDPSVSTVSCEAPSNTVADSTDCDDTDATENPDADEVCDGDDDDCDGDIDEDSAIDATTWYPDADGDGYGDTSLGAPACTQPSGTVTDGTDCDDTDATENPAADEVCDGDDDNCDGVIDEATAIDAPTWYTDADGDGFGDSTASTAACTQPTGTVTSGTDCDDTNPTVHPDAEEECWSTTDTDCDGDVALADSDCAPDGTVATADVDVSFAGPASHARLASALAANGDINGDGFDDLVVTSEAYGDGQGWVFLGSASVASSTWTLSTADMVLPDGAASGNLGASAALADISGDGLADVILADPHDDSAASNGGRVYAHFGAVTLTSSRSPSSADFIVETAEASAQLGVVSAGDLDGDGIAELVVGAPAADGQHGTMPQAGRVGLFIGPVSGTADLDDADRLLAGDHPSDAAGTVLAVVPDMDGDGLDDLVVTAPARDWDDESDGAVYVFTDATAGDDGKLFSANLLIRGAGNAFSGSVAGGDLDADGYSDLVVGVAGDDTTSTDAGAVLVFSGPYGSGTRLDASDATHTVLGEARNDDAGEAVAVGDVDGDGYADLLVGAGDHDQGGANAGAVYGLRGPLSGTVTLSSADWEQEGSAGDGLGAVLATGDLDGDGYADVVAASPSASGAYSSSGEVSVVLGGGRVETPTTPAVVDPTDDADGDGYTEAAGDCDDTRAAIYPGAAETCDDGLDDDCDGVDPGCSFDTLEDPDSSWMAVHGASSNRTGTVVLGAFDVNGDGQDDLAIGSPNDDSVGIWFGPVPEGPTRTGAPDLLVEGAYGMGESIARAGDVNGDGIDDLVFGAPDSDDTYSNGGAVYVLYGDTHLGGTLDFPTDADLVFTPESDDDGLGVAVAGGTDLDGDGIDDLLLGADAGNGRLAGEGAVYVVLGGRTSGTWSVSTADHIYGGETYSDEVGASVAFAGDVNGDGEQDILIGAPDHIESRGGAYLVFGPLDAGFTDLATVRGRFIGSDYSGTTVAGVGDLNADGYDDIAIGAPGFTGSSAAPVGALHVYFGPLAPAHHDLDDAPLVLEGDSAGDMMGLSVASASGGSTDVDGDGYADLLVGTPYSDVYSSDAGGAWLYYGPLSAGTLATSDADVAFEGYWSGYTGTALDVVGDVDGDGYTDVLVGAPNARNSSWSWVVYSYAGASYVWRGGDRGSTVVVPATVDPTDDADGDGYTEDGGDCDDTDASVYPGATEVCDNDLDDDCDGVDLWCLASGSVSVAADPTLQSATNYDHGTATVLTDLDGDGYDDLVVGERASRTGATNGGQVYWMFGPLPRGEVELTGVRDPDRGVYASTRDDYLGGDVWVAGDVDGDGLDDLLAGATGAGTGGSAYLLVGQLSTTGSVDVSTEATTTFEGAASGDDFGSRVSSGDLNGDGVPDFVVTAPDADDGHTDAGTAYVFLGPVTAGTVSAGSADATVSADTYLAGLDAVEVIGDTDGDGLDDLLLGAPGHEGSAATYGTGEAWLFTSGPTSGTLTTDDADTTFEAESASDGLGADVAGGGDVDGDGLVEVLVGADSTSAGTYTRGGIAYFFYGGSVATGAVDVGTADTRFMGTTSNAYVGDGIGTAGDVDGDGLDDLLIGEPRNDELHLFRAPIPSGDVLLSSSDAALWPWGETYGGQVGVPGDQDGDGYDDIVVAAPDSLGRVWVSPGGID